MAEIVNGARKRRRQYTPVACKECRRRKIKCDGFRTCRRCTKLHIICVYDRPLQGGEQFSEWMINDETVRESRLPPFQVCYDGDFHALQTNTHTAKRIRSRASPGIERAVQHSTQSTQNVGSQYGATSARKYSLGITVAESSPLSQPDVFGFLSSQNEHFHFNSEAITGGSALSELHLSKIEALELIDSFREEAETLYPFIDLQEMKELIEELSRCSIATHKATEDRQTNSWHDLEDRRNMDFLRLILACALAAKEKKETDTSQGLINTAETNNFHGTRKPQVDFKNIAIATMLSVYHYQCDEMTLAWRKIGVAARLCLELGMHQESSFRAESATARQVPWMSKMFWCIYVLDRRYSFMTNLPFTFRDDDIDLKLPLSDKSSSYLLPMVTYGRLGAKIIPAVPKFGRAATYPDIEAYTSLGKEIDTWMQSTKADLISPPMNGTQDSEAVNYNIYRLQVFLNIRCNQMRLSLYKHALYSPESIAKSQNFARLAVRYAKENIRVFDQLKTTNNYESQAVQNSFFLVSSLAVLFLAVKNASQQFGGAIHEYFLGLGLLKSLCMTSNTSKTLCKKTQALETAINGLSVQRIRSFSTFSLEHPDLEDELQRIRPPADLLEELSGSDAESRSELFEMSLAGSAYPSLDFESFMDDDILDLDSGQGFSSPYDNEIWPWKVKHFSQNSAMVLDIDRALNQRSEHIISAGPAG